MQTIVLVRYEVYRKYDLVFKRNVPQTVDDNVAKYLLDTGSFRCISAEEFSGEGASLFEGGMVQMGEDGLPHQAKNRLGADDLSNKSILFRRRGGIGDHVFVAILSQQIKEAYPTAYITMAVQSESIPFVSSFDAVDSVISVEDSRKSFSIGKYDYIVDFGGTLGSEHNTALDDEDYLQAHWEVAGWSGNIPYPVPALSVAKLTQKRATMAQVDSLLDAAAFPSEYVVFLLGTSNPLKRLTLDTINEIADGLCKAGIPVLCLGGKNDRSAQVEHKLFYEAIGLPVAVSAELVRRSAVTVGSDTGLLQFASAIGVPTVSLWGPTDHRLSIGHYSGKRKIFSAEGALACAPCKRLRSSFCPYYKGGYADCMRSMNPKHIVDSTVDMYNKYKDHPAKTQRALFTPAKQNGKKDRPSVAFLLDVGGKFTGGGFYTWSLAKQFQDHLKCNVTVFTDVPTDQFVYTREDVVPKGLRVVQCGDLRNWTGGHSRYDVVVGTPPYTGERAVAEQKETGGYSILLVYETPNYIKGYRTGVDTKEEYWAGYKDALRKADAVFAISSTVKKALYEWLPELKEKDTAVWLMRPHLNDGVAAGMTTFQKEDVVILIGRNEPYKRLRETMACIGNSLPKYLDRPFELVVIGDGVKKLDKYAQKTWGCTVTLAENVTEREKWEWLHAAKVLVHPSDFEGFGIPVAEGLYAGAYVITKPLPVLSHEFKDSIHTYTSDEELLEELRVAFDEWDKVDPHRPGKRRKKGVSIKDVVLDRRKFVERRFTSPVSKRTLIKFFREKVKPRVKPIDKPVSTSNLRVAYVTPWNTECGVADTLSQVLAEAEYNYKIFSYTDIPPIRADDNASVVRCWNRQFKDFQSLVQNILDYGPDVVHIQHEHSLFQDRDNFFDFLRILRTQGVKTVVTLHTYLPDRFTDEIAEAADLIITTKEQPETPENFTPIHLPSPQWGIYGKNKARQECGFEERDFVIGSFGLWQEHKGFRELIRAFPDFGNAIPQRNIRFLISGNPPKNSQYHQEVRRKYLKLLNNDILHMYNDYAPVEELRKRLSACDVLVFNYSIAHYSSASAAIRTGMACHVPVVCTTSPMFSEFLHEKEVLKVTFDNQAQLVEAVARIAHEPELAETLVANTDTYLANCSPKKIAEKHEAAYKRLVAVETAGVAAHA